jgi:hypothetical protein
MAAGYIPTKQDVDNAVGGRLVRLREALKDVQEFDVWLVENESRLSGLGYSTTATTGDVAVMRAAFAAAARLARAAFNQEGAPLPADDYFFHARKLTGLR